MGLFSLTKKSEYALVMLAELVDRGKGKRLNLSEMAEMGLPRAFMAQVAKELVEEDILSSKEGRDGGYSLVYDAEEVNLKEVLEMVEGETGPVGCVVKGGVCPMADGCGHQGVMEELNEKIERVLEEYTLADLSRLR